MKKSTMVVALVVAGTIGLASMTFAGNQDYNCPNNQSYMQNSNGSNQYSNANMERCPWYKRWFGMHNNNCSWNNSNNNSGCC